MISRKGAGADTRECAGRTIRPFGYPEVCTALEESKPA